jgi:hypothetical protein
MKEAQVFFQTAADSDHLDGSCPPSPGDFYLQIKTEMFQTTHGVLNDLLIGIVDAQRVVSVATFGIEDARQKSFTPTNRRRCRPLDYLLYALYTPTRRGTDRMDVLPSNNILLENETSGRHTKLHQVARRLFEGLLITKRQAKLINDLRLVASRPSVRMNPQMSVSAHDAAQVPDLVIIVFLRRRCECPDPYELVVRR